MRFCTIFFSNFSLFLQEFCVHIPNSDTYIQKYVSWFLRWVILSMIASSRPSVVIFYRCLLPLYSNWTFLVHLDAPLQSLWKTSEEKLKVYICCISPTQLWVFVNKWCSDLVSFKWWLVIGTGEILLSRRTACMTMTKAQSFAPKTVLKQHHMWQNTPSSKPKTNIPFNFD